MRQRLFALMLTTFGFPIAYLGVEAILWAIQAPTLTGTLLNYMPELLRLLFVLWFLAIAYMSGRVVWLATAQFNPWPIRAGARVIGIIAFSLVLFLAGGFVISTWISQITVRVVPSGERVVK